jgi:hypothetical protein
MTNKELGSKLVELIQLLDVVQHGPSALISGDTYEQAQSRALENLGKVAREIVAEGVHTVMNQPVGR